MIFLIKSIIILIVYMCFYWNDFCETNKKRENDVSNNRVWKSPRGEGFFWFLKPKHFKLFIMLMEGVEQFNGREIGEGAENYLQLFYDGGGV